MKRTILLLALALILPLVAQAQDGGGGENPVTATVPLTLSIAAGDDGVIAIDSAHLVVESFGSVLRVSELYLFGNQGDQPYTGQPGPQGQVTTVQVPLPQDAVGLAFAEGITATDFIQVEGGLWDTRPVLPGQETLQIFYSYHLPVMGETVRLERSYRYPVGTLNILLVQPGLALRSDQLLDMGLQSFEDRQYRLYAAANLPAGVPLTVDLVVEPVEAVATPTPTQPAAPITGDHQGLLRELGFGLAGLAVLGAVLYPLLTTRRRAPGQAAPALNANPQARRLLAELADLEEAFEAGRIDEETWQQQRAEKREAIRSLWP
jgi:hypothetical protein